MIRQDFENHIELLREHGVDKLYHITSRDNWESIRKHGLYSVELMRQRGIEGHRSYNDIVTRKSDEAAGLNRYIHLSFSSNPIFLEAGIKAGIIESDYIVLEISLDVLKDADAEFVNMNPHHLDVTRGTSYEALEAIHFSAATSTDRLGIRLKQRKYCQAEVLVPGNIPPELILNRQDVDNLIYNARIGDSLKRRAIVILIDQSMTMGTQYIMSGKQFPSVTSAIQEFVNKFLTTLAKDFYLDGGGVNKYDIAVLGSTDGKVTPLWNRQNFGPVYQDNGASSPFLSSEDLYNIMVGNVAFSSLDWITIGHESWNSQTVEALKSIKVYLQSWIDSNHNDSYPPIVLYMTDGGHIQHDVQAFVKVCTEIRKLQTRAGNTMLWQLEYTPFHSDNLILPTDMDIQGLDPTGSLMYQQASEISDIYKERIDEVSTTKNVLAPHRAMAVNLDINTLSSIILEC
jgi:hypothetical protein